MHARSLPFRRPSVTAAVVVMAIWPWQLRRALRLKGHGDYIGNADDRCGNIRATMAMEAVASTMLTIEVTATTATATAAMRGRNLLVVSQLALAMGEVC